jgi:dCMP deaminase
MKNKEKQLYMEIAKRVADQSYATRLKVGAVLVTESGLLSIGYNGTFPGEDNCCEMKVAVPAGEPFDSSVRWDADTKAYYKLVTKPETYHAEENVISKLLEEGVPAKNGTLFLTHSPCLPCAKILAKAKIKALYFASMYRDPSGLEFLLSKGITVEQYV